MFFMVGLSFPRKPQPLAPELRALLFGVAAMLEVHPAPDGFTVYDTEAGEAVIKFRSRAEADEMIATLQIEDVHAKLQRWAPDAVPLTY
jgi:hypothetical protein